MTLTLNNSNLKQDETRPIVKGDRTCLHCQGICHEDSVRKVVPQGFGFRSHYFCGIHCLNRYYSKKFYEPYRILMRSQNKEEQFETEMMEKAEEMIAKGRYEYVDVITL